MIKRLFFGLVVIATIATAQVATVQASTSDFIIRDFQADYYLNKDSNGRSTLKTVEKITADFPSIDQNHGIERAIPQSYDGHTTHLDIQSVVDATGKNLDYSTSNQNDNLVLRIGDSGVYVHGLRDYVITYSQRDVTRYFVDTKLDEFYWDTNGIAWSQPFDKVTARLHLGSAIQESRAGASKCYFGVEGSTAECSVIQSDGVITASATKLGAAENLTIVVGFKPNTFSPYSMSVIDFIEKYSLFIAAAIVAILLGVMYWLKLTKGKGASGRGIIIAKYLPPSGVDVALSSVIVNKPATWAAAMYVDLAVRHKLKIIELGGETKAKSSYSMEFITSEGLTYTEKAVISILFGDDPQPGARYDIDPENVDLKSASALTKTYRKVVRSATKGGYYVTDRKLRSAMVALTILIGLQSFISGYVGIIGIVVAIIIIVTTKPMSIQGRELFDYLKGLELYIKSAEEDRIKVLQSPQGADRTPVDTNNNEMLLHLYERVLPYAVLFGNEKEWTKALGRYYEQQSTKPDWYAGNGAFNAATFGVALSSFSDSAVSNSYVSSSSSTGGGGFSGGGGGGGGGGGW